MDDAPIFTGPHRRLNPLTGEWLLVSPHRTERPWQGQIEDEPPPRRSRPTTPPATCARATSAPAAYGQPAYTSTFVFDNDFAALKPDTPPGRIDDDGLLVAEGERGMCRVVCFSPAPRPDARRRLAASAPRGRRHLDRAVHRARRAVPVGTHVQIFENRGAMMGASNPHPHGQIWATERLPNEPAARSGAARLLRRPSAAPACCATISAAELPTASASCARTRRFVALVPFWAVWPFETLVLPRATWRVCPTSTPTGATALADAPAACSTRYDNLFEMSFPYSMGFHQRPPTARRIRQWHLHAHFYPPLLRSATVRKFMVGYELLATPQRDITPESAASGSATCRTATRDAPAVGRREPAARPVR